MVLHHKDIVSHFSKHQGITKLSPSTSAGMLTEDGQKIFGYCQPPGLAKVDNNRFTFSPLLHKL